MPELSNQLIPPGVNDERARAFLAMIEKGMGEIDPDRLLVKRVYDVPSDALPSLVVEYSAQPYLVDGVREPFVRDVLANIFELKARTGTVEGCLFGLSLLGMEARWTQWFAEVPKGKPGTYKARIFLEEPVVEGDVSVLSKGTQLAALRMVAAMKRHSQEGTIGFGLSRRGEVKTYGYARSLATKRIGFERPKLITGQAGIAASGLIRTARIVRLSNHLAALTGRVGLVISGFARSSRRMRIA